MLYNDKRLLCETRKSDFFSVFMSERKYKHCETSSRYFHKSWKELPDYILEVTNTASLNLLPAKSHQIYEKQYKHCRPKRALKL